MEIIEIGGKQYKVELAETEAEKEEGLQGIKKLPNDQGMLFVYNKPQTVGFWMKDTLIPLDIIFIDEDQEVISIYQGKPEDETIVEEDNVKYVLEVNQNSGIEEGDELEFEDSEEDDESDSKQPPMQVIASDGSVQMELQGGERIFSRRSTKILIKKAKKAEASKLDKDYKALGRYIFQELDRQDNRKPEYVQSKD